MIFKSLKIHKVESPLKKFPADLADFRRYIAFLHSFILAFPHDFDLEEASQSFVRFPHYFDNVLTKYCSVPSLSSESFTRFAPFSHNLSVIIKIASHHSVISHS